MLGAGLLARKAKERGLKAKPWVKTSLAPGSRVVTDYFARAGLSDDLAAIGFYLVGYGCTTCIGNSGPLRPEISAAVKSGDITACSVLSGNRNFEGRVHPEVKMNFLASPPLVVAYAIAGTLDIDLTREPIGVGSDGKPVMLADIWPSDHEVAETVLRSIDSTMFRQSYSGVFTGDANWAAIKVPAGKRYAWDAKSTYVKNPPYFDGMTMTPGAIRDIKGARVLAVLGDSVTTDHISPAGSEGLQLVRRPARQSRSDDARNVREHSPAQSHGSWCGRRRHGAFAGERTDVHLRCGHALQAAGSAARDHRGP
jgi:aconitate hydratase